jgi:hypothetical protein
MIASHTKKTPTVMYHGGIINRSGMNHNNGQSHHQRAFRFSHARQRWFAIVLFTATSRVLKSGFGRNSGSKQNADLQCEAIDRLKAQNERRKGF